MLKRAMEDGDNSKEAESLLSKRGKKLLQINDDIVKSPMVDLLNQKRRSRIEKAGKKIFTPRSKSLFGYKTELIKDKILEAKETFYLDPAILTHYPPSPTGMESIKISCSNFISNHLSCKMSPQNLIITPGTTATLDMLAYTLFDPSDTLLCPAPYYAKYHEIFVTKNNINLVSIPFEDINTPKLSRSLFESTYLKCKKVKGILISNPHNPTGSIFSPDQLRDIIQFTEDKKIALIMDEAAAFSVYDDDHKEEFETILKNIERFNRYKNIFWTWSFSKDMLLPGLRFSLAYMEDEKTYECMNRLSTYHTVNGLTQNFAEEFLQDNQWFNELQKTKNEELLSNREMAMIKLRELRIPFVKPLGGFLIYFDLSHLDHNILINFLENNIYFEQIGGEDYDGYKKGWFAVSLCQKRQHLYDVLEKMGNVIKEYSEKRTLQKERSISYIVADDVIKQVLEFLDHSKDNEREIVRKISESTSNFQLIPDFGKRHNETEKDSIDHIVNECHLSSRGSRDSVNSLTNKKYDNMEKNKISLYFNDKSQQKDEILLQSPTSNKKNNITIDDDCQKNTSPGSIGEKVDKKPSMEEDCQSHILNYNGIDNTFTCTKINCPICEMEKRKEKGDDKISMTTNPVNLEEVFQTNLIEGIDRVKNDWISDLVRRNSQRRSKSYDVTRRNINTIDEEETNRDIDYIEKISENTTTTTISHFDNEGEIDYKESGMIKVQVDNDKVNPGNTIKMDNDEIIKTDSTVKRQVLPADNIGNDSQEVDDKPLPSHIPLKVIFNQPKSGNVVTKNSNNHEITINLNDNKTKIKEQLVEENDDHCGEKGDFTMNDIKKVESIDEETKGTVIRKEDNFMKLDSDTLTIDSISDIVIEDGDIIIVEEKKTIIEGGDSDNDKNSILLDCIFNKNNSNLNNITPENNSPSNGRKVIESEKSNSYTVRSINNTKSEMEKNKSNISLNQIFLNDGDQKEFKDKVFDNMYVLTKGNDDYKDRFDGKSTATITFCRAETNIETPFDHHKEEQKISKNSQLIEPSKVMFLSTEELNVNEDGTKIYSESSYDTEMDLKKDEDVDKASIHFKDHLKEQIFITFDNTKINDEVFMGIMEKKSVELKETKLNGYDNENTNKQLSPITVTTDDDSNASFSFIKIPNNSKQDNTITEVLKIDKQSVVPQEYKEENSKNYNPIDLNLIFTQGKSTTNDHEYMIDEDGDKVTTNKPDSGGEENETQFDGSFSSSVGGRRYLTHEYRKVSSYHVPHSGVEKKIQKKNTTDGYNTVDDVKSCDSGFTGDKIDHDPEIKTPDPRYEDGGDWRDDITKEDLRRSSSLKDDGRKTSDESDNINERNKEWIQDWERTNSFKDINKKEPRERGTSFTEVTVDLSDIIGISIQENNSELGDSAYLSMSPELRKKDKRDSGYCRDSIISAETRKSYTPRRLSYSYDISSDGTITTPNDAMSFLRECKKDNNYNGTIPNQWNLANEVIETDNKSKKKYIEYAVTRNEYKSIPSPINYEVTNDILLEVRLIQRQQGSAVGYYYPPKKDAKSYVTELHLLPTPDYNFYSTELHIPKEEMYVNSNCDGKKEVDYIHPVTNTKHFVIKSFQSSPSKRRRIEARPLKFESNYCNGKDGVKITYEIFKKTKDDVINNSIISIKDSTPTSSIYNKDIGQRTGNTISNSEKKSWYITSIKKTPRPAFKVAGSLTIDIQLPDNHM